MANPYLSVPSNGALSRYLQSFYLADLDDGDREILSPPTGYAVLGHVYRGFHSSVVDGEVSTPPKMPFNILAGPLYRKQASVRWAGGMGHAAAEFTATGVWELFHLNAARLINAAFPVSLLDLRIDRTMMEAFAEHGPGPQAFEAALAPLADSARAAPDFVTEAVRRIEETAGVIRLGEICAQTGTSVPTLIKWFRRVVGLPPKYFARVVQFNHVGTLIMSGDTDSVAQLAAEAGFFDQAHFSRVVQEFVLMKPRAFLESDISRIATFVRQGRHET